MSGFDGTWQIDLAEAKVWNSELGVFEPDQVGQEIITIRTDGDIQDYEVLYGANPVIRMGYRARFNDPEWTTYLVRGIETPDGGDPATAIAEFRERIKANSGTLAREFEVGKPYGMVRMIAGDERTHYRLARDPNSDDILYIMPRRLDEDGNRFVATILDRDGVISRVRPFIRIADAEVSGE